MSRVADDTFEQQLIEIYPDSHLTIYGRSAMSGT